MLENKTIDSMHIWISSSLSLPSAEYFNENTPKIYYISS